MNTFEGNMKHELRKRLMCVEKNHFLVLYFFVVFLKLS